MSLHGMRRRTVHASQTAAPTISEGDSASDVEELTEEEAAKAAAEAAALAAAARELLQRVLQAWWSVTAASLVEARRRLQRRGGNALGIGGLGGEVGEVPTAARHDGDGGDGSMGLWSRLRGDREGEREREFTCRMAMLVWRSNATALRAARRRAASAARGPTAAAAATPTPSVASSGGNSAPASRSTRATHGRCRTPQVASGVVGQGDSGGSSSSSSSSSSGARRRAAAAAQHWKPRRCLRTGAAGGGAGVAPAVSSTGSSASLLGRCTRFGDGAISAELGSSAAMRTHARPYAGPRPSMVARARMAAAAPTCEPWERGLGSRPDVPVPGITKSAAAAAKALLAAAARPPEPQQGSVQPVPQPPKAPARRPARRSAPGGGCAARRRLAAGKQQQQQQQQQQQHVPQRWRRVKLKPQETENALLRAGGGDGQCQTARRMYTRLFGKNHILAAPPLQGGSKESQQLDIATRLLAAVAPQLPPKLQLKSSSRRTGSAAGIGRSATS